MTIFGRFLTINPAYISTYQYITSTYNGLITCIYGDFFVTLGYNN